MKILCVILFFAPSYLLGQQVFYSPFTHTYPNLFQSRIIKVNRTITFEPNTITIATETEAGKEIEVLNIQAVDNVNENLVFLCENRSNRKITIAIPEDQEQIELIDYYFRSLETNEETQLRFYVEELKNEPIQTTAKGNKQKG